MLKPTKPMGIQKKKNEYEDLKNKLEYFKTHFLKVYKEI